MVMAWPANLPLLVRADSYQITRDYGVVQSATELGPIKARRRRTVPVCRRQMTLVFKDTELPIWEGFLEQISGGAEAFSWRPPFGGATETVRLQVPPGGLVLSQTANQAGVPRWSLNLLVEVLQ